MSRLTKKAHFIYAMIFVTLTVILLDQFIKWFSAAMPIGEKIILIPKVLWFTHIQNTGVSFGMFQGNNLLLIFVTLVILGALIYNYDKFTTRAARVAYWLVIGGLFGNLIDRVLRGSVVDMFDLGWFPVFNIADSAICIAVVILLLEELFVMYKTYKARPSIKKVS